MTLKEINDNLGNLGNLDKETLARFINELLINIKLKESKNISLKTEIKFLKRNLNKVKKMIDRVIENNDNKEINYLNKQV